MSEGGSRATASAARNGRAGRTTGAKAGTASAASKRNGKFNAAGEWVGTQWCASASEAERYRQLLRMEAAGRIGDLRCQVPFRLAVNNQLVTTYRADFCYSILDDHGRPLREVIEDVKGMVTPEFKLKHKLFDALQPIPLTIIHIKGMARHRDRPADKRSAAGWVDLHWRDRLPE